MSRFIVKIWTRQQALAFQTMLIKAGYEVKTGGRETFECRNEGDIVFMALQFRPNAYMCRINRLYVTEADQIPVAV